MAGWMDDERFQILFNSISVISGRCGDNFENLCAVEARFLWQYFCLKRVWNPGLLHKQAR